MKQSPLGFKLQLSSLKNNVFIPRYYNPEIKDRLDVLKNSHELVQFESLINNSYVYVATGHEIGKMAYGTGDIPFVRTSDISNWEIKNDPKQGVSQTKYEEYAEVQDVQAGDIFFVRDGTYLIGQSCIITEHDLPCLYQSHILKFRVSQNSPVSNWLLLALLNTPIVKSQIRAKQFTADIIDTIGNRYYELLFPIPKNSNRTLNIVKKVRNINDERVKLREIIRKIPYWAEGNISDLDGDIPQNIADIDELSGNTGFVINSSNIRSKILIPKYYDPQIDNDLKSISKTHDLVSLSELQKAHIICWETGIEIGKMAYGTGDIPFIRTSDITNWELKTDPKQNVSEELYEINKQDIKPEDIFIVRDGTYLVGTSCIITSHDTKILYCGGIYRIRVNKKDKLNPYLLLALLNTPIVKRQIRSKQFTRDIIDTIGKRLFEVIIPIPKGKRQCERIIQKAQEVIFNRVNLREQIRGIGLEIEGYS